MFELAPDTRVDRILHHLAQPDDETAVMLNEDDKMHLDRMSYADQQLRRGFPPRIVANMLQRKYLNPRTGTYISQSTAYRIINDAQVGFGGSAAFVQNYWKQLAHEMIMDAYRMAKEAQDVRGMQKSIEQLTSLLALNSEDSNKIPEDALMRISISVTARPEDAGLTRTSWDEVQRLYREVTGKEAPKVIDITPNEP